MHKNIYKIKSIWTNIFHKLYLLDRNVLEYIFIYFGFMSLLKKKHPIFLFYTYTEQTPKNHKAGVYKNILFISS